MPACAAFAARRRGSGPVAGRARLADRHAELGGQRAERSRELRARHDLALLGGHEVSVRLCELELPYLLHNVAKRSPSRPAFIARSGKMMVPWLFDPNTGTQLHESADILAYLDTTYAL